MISVAAFAVRYLARLARLGVLTSVFLPLFAVAGFALVPLVGGRRPQLLRWYLQTCGAGFVKIGQILAMRYDLLSPAYCLELARLLDANPKVRPEVIFAEIERGLGRGIRDCFAHVEFEPLGAASLAQVHEARLHTGERVAVKVMRPGIRRLIRMDLASLRWLAWLLDLTGLFLPLRLKSVVRENELLMMEELDFRREARHADLLHHAMAGDVVDHCSPRVYWDLTSTNVITMELFEGVWCTELLEAVTRDDQRKLAAWRQVGITPRRAGRLIFRSIMEQCYHHRVFHADPHAGNLVFLPGGTLGYIDFGMTGWLDERQWSQQYRLFESIASERLHQAFEAMLDTLEPLNVRDVVAFETEFKGLLRDWMIAVRNPKSTIEEKSTGRFLWRATLAMRRAGLRLPLSVMRLHRATITADMIELKLDPHLDLVAEMRKFFLEDACRAALELPDAAPAVTASAAQLRMVRALPTTLVGMADAVQHHLPRLLRNYTDIPSRIERATNIAFRYLRTTCLFVAVALLVSIWWVPDFLQYEPSLNRPERIVAIASLALATWILSKMIRFYDEPG